MQSRGIEEAIKAASATALAATAAMQMMAAHVPAGGLAGGVHPTLTGRGMLADAATASAVRGALGGADGVAPAQREPSLSLSPTLSVSQAVCLSHRSS